VEKGLAATRPAAKQKALEAILLYIELDKPDPIVDELLPILSHKQPKIIAATLSALTSIYHAYGCKTVEPKPTLKLLPKMFGHADKNVRAEAQNLTVEFYRWLKDAMKPLFWNDLKPVQQQDLEKLFERIKDEPPPRQERLLRSQQAIEESAAVGPADAGDVEVDEGGGEIDLEPEYEAVNVLSKVPKDLQERLASTKWKDRKEALDDLHKVIDHPRIADGSFDDILRALAKCMKDANITVVTAAANCIELLAKGLKRGFAKYRSTVMDPMMERLKEKKQSVTDAIGAALDAVFGATSLSECLEGVLEFLKHKNPQVKLESTRFLIRCLKNTREPPQPPEIKSIADAATKLLTESQETQRSAGAEVLGTLWKIMGDRAMGPFLNDLDEIRKTKIKEFYESAEVKAKNKPKPAAAPPKPAPNAQKRMGMVGKKPPALAAPGIKKPVELPVEEPVRSPAPRPASRPVSKIGPPKSGLATPSGLRAPGGLQKRIPGPSSLSSPARRVASPVEEVAPAPPPKIGMGPNRGLAGRPLARPAPETQPSVTPSGLAGLNSAERAELEEIRAEVDRFRREAEMFRSDKALLSSKVAELTNQNSELIEDHDREVLSLKAKEKAKERHVEALEQQVQTQQKEIERLKRELSRQVRASSPPPYDLLQDAGAGTGMAGIRTSRAFATSPTAKSVGSTGSGGLTNTEGKENFAPSEWPVPLYVRDG
jgi:protein STU2